MSADPQPRQIRPEVRAGDNRWNQGQDWWYRLYRELGDGEEITGLSVTVRDGARTVLYSLERGDPEVQRVVIADHGAIAQAVTEARDGAA